MGKPRKMNINSLANLKNFRSMIKSEVVSQTIIDALARKGEEIIRNSLSLKTYEHDTMNLYDSYVYGVYKNGVLVKRSEVTTEAKVPNHKKWGRVEATKFLEEMANNVGPGISLVVGASMFYSGILESNGYVVLVNIEAAMNRILANGIEGSGYVTDIPEGLLNGVTRRISGTNYYDYYGL
jgi:hypothetical protein